MSFTITVAKSQRPKLITRARSRFWRVVCALVKHGFGKVKYEIRSPSSGAVIKQMRECWCGRLWAKGGLSNACSGDVVTSAHTAQE